MLRFFSNHLKTCSLAIVRMTGAQDLSREEFQSYILSLDRQYHEEGTTTVTDDEYDELKHAFETKFGQMSTIGHPVPARSAVMLPYFMGSQNKIKDSGTLGKWASKYPGPYIVSDKLDGVSALYINGQLYTRGNGKVGRDISHLVEHLQLPKIDSDACVRGEIILAKKTFNQLVDDETLPYQSVPRNTVAGCINSKAVNLNIAKKMDFVAFEMIQPKLNHEIQGRQLQTMGFKCVNTVRLDVLQTPELEDILTERKRMSAYQIDGIVIHDASKVHDNQSDSNPQHSFAFKMPTKTIKAIVESIEWNISKDSLAKPTIKLERVILDGIKISRVTGFNAKYITDNSLGKGSVVQLTRSGDVIPHIVSVVSATQADMPEFDYKWNASGVDIIMTDQRNAYQKKLQLKIFQNTISKLNIRGVKEATIATLFDSGIKDLKSLLSLDYQKVKELQLAGFQNAKIDALLESIKRSKKNLNCVKLMDASNCFGKGFSINKISRIVEKFDDVLSRSITAEEVCAIDGFGSKSAQQFVQNLEKFRLYIDENNLGSYCIPKGTSDDAEVATGPLSGKHFCFSGGQISEAVDMINQHGGCLLKSLSSDCTHLIVSDKGRSTSKSLLAGKRGIPIINVEDLKRLIRKESP